MFERIAGQEQVKKTLGAMIASKRIPHALLFSGPNGVGKTETAFDLARMLLCHNDVDSGCDSCSSCTRASKLEHPDLHLLFPFRAQPTGSDSYENWIEGLQEHRKLLVREYYAPVVYEKGLQIVIGMVNEVHDRLRESSFEGGRRVCVILNADSLNVKTANALLKILEEPPPGVHFILTTERLSSVLPTITSRASIIRFRRLRNSEIESYLQMLGIADSEIRNSIARSSEGSLKTAKSLAFSDSVERYNRALDLFVRAATGDYGDVVAGSAPFLWSRDNLEVEELVFNFIRLTREILETKLNVNTVNGERSEISARLSKFADFQSLHRLSAGYESGLDMLGRNVNKSLVMSTIQYEIHDAFGKRTYTSGNDNL